MNTARYVLTYWPIAFRGCFVSYLFAWADVAIDIMDDMDAIIRLKSRDPAEQPLPFIGPPLLEDRQTGSVLSQTPAIIMQYAPDLGLIPDDRNAAARAMKVQMDCNDLLMEICRYNGSYMWDRETWTEFRKIRLPRWMASFEQELVNGVIGADEVNFADIAVYALFGNMTRCLPELAPDLKQHAPRISALCDRIGAKPSLAACIAKQEDDYGKLYCGGQIEESIRKQLALDEAMA